MSEYQRITIDDVARQAGVSTATVSRALNEPHKVRESTRQRINTVVDALGYTPHFGGKVLASNRSMTVGAVIPTMDNALFASGLQAFQQTLGEQGLVLLVASSDYNAAIEYQQIRALVARGIDALLLIGDSRPQTTWRFLARSGVPTVCAWSYRQSRHRLHVGFDNRAAAATLAQAILERGHRRIGMIAGVTNNNDRAGDRLRGVQETVQGYGQGARLLDQIECPYTVDAGGLAFAQLMQHKSPPTAILCGNDVLAVGAIAEARRIGVGVPGDVSIAGFDDIPLASMVTPALTTVHVPHLDMGRSAANTLLALLRGEHTASLCLPTRIVWRESVARL